MNSKNQTIVEFSIVLAAVLAIMALTSLTQERINVEGGQGFDGVIYHNLAETFLDGRPRNGASRFLKRIGTPFLATLADPEDLTNGFLVVNTSAALISSVLLLLWLRRHLRSPWLRVFLVVLCATHWLQLVRFTFFYPVLVDAWAQLCCFAGLNCMAWYERRPGRWPLIAVAVISMIGVLFRELVLLIPVAFLFARNPQIRHQSHFPYLRVTNFPRLEQWVPLVVASTAFVWAGEFVVAADPGFSATAHLGERAFRRSLVSFTLGWFVAFGPALFVVLYDWKSAATFFSRHRALLVFTVGVAVIGWAGSLESERHAVNLASPVILLLLGLTIERHHTWFRSRALLTGLLAGQALVNRVFWTVPQPDQNYLERSPIFLLTPLGNDATYLHLFPDYLPSHLAELLVIEYAVLGAVIVTLLSRRAYLESLSAAQSSKR